MSKELFEELLNNETDLENALDRFCCSKDLYVKCLKSFVEDTTMTELTKAIACGDWDEVFTAAHAIKGVAGNMGFVPLFYAASEFVVLVRKGKTDEITSSYKKLSLAYERIIDIIKRNCLEGEK